MIENTTQYWLNTDKMEFLGDFEAMYQNIEDPWQCSLKVNNFINQCLLDLIKQQDKEYNKILDIGCGLGDFLNNIHKVTKASECYGYDISKTAIDKAMKKFPNIHFKTKNILKETIEIKNVDLIILSEVIWYILDDIDFVFTNLAQALAVGGGASCGLLIIKQYFPIKQNYGNDVIDGIQGFINFITKTSFVIKEQLIYKKVQEEKQVAIFILHKKEI